MYTPDSYIKISDQMKAVFPRHNRNFIFQEVNKIYECTKFIYTKSLFFKKYCRFLNNENNEDQQLDVPQACWVMLS